MQPLTSGALLDALRGVHWPARRVTSSAVHGGHRSRRVGSSPEFMDYRPYQQGDDPAKIDWKLFGRTERVAIRLSHDDSSIRTSVLVDSSASMAYPPGRLAKWELAASIALGLCAVAHGDGDPVGLVVAGGDTLRSLPPRTRRGTVAHALRLLLDTHPAGSAPVAPVLASLGSSRRIAIISDFLGDADALLDQARALLARECEIFAVHAVAEEELAPPALGVVVDPETPALRRPLHASEIDQYRERFAQWREALARKWRESGAVYHLATTGESAARVVRRVVAAPEGSALPA